LRDCFERDRESSRSGAAFGVGSIAAVHSVGIGPPSTALFDIELSFISTTYVSEMDKGDTKPPEFDQSVIFQTTAQA
jgi:hypothetical protein